MVLIKKALPAQGHGPGIMIFLFYFMMIQRGPCIVTINEALVLERLPRDLGITGPPGEHLPYWDQIPYTRFLFDFW